MLKTINILAVTKEAGAGSCYRNYLVDCEAVGDEKTLPLTVMVRIQQVIEYAEDFGVTEKEALTRLVKRQACRQYESQVPMKEEAATKQEGDSVESVASKNIVV